MGNTAEIDLIGYFYDKNDDELEFGVYETSGDQNINIEIDGSLMHFSSIEDWAGEDWVIFYGEDEEFATVTNRIKLKVLAGIYGPTVDLINPSDEAVMNERDFVFEFRATDSFVENLVCGIYVNDLLKFSKDVVSGSVDSFYLSNLVDGSYLWNVRCDNGDYSASAEDDFGFEVSAPDAPVFSSIGSKKIAENETLEFSVRATDPEGDDFSLSAQNLPSGASFVDNGNGRGLFSWTPGYDKAGVYNLRFVAEDTTGLISYKNVGVTVENAKEPPRFDDVDLCETKSSDIEIKIKEPDDNDEFEVGEEIEVEIEIENNGEEDLDFDVEVHLYDLDDDESVEEEEGELDVDEGDEEEIEFVLKIPSDVEDNDFVILVIAEDGDYCSYEYVEIDLEKPDHLVVLEDIKMVDSVEKGDSFEVSFEVANRGEDDEEDVYVVAEILGLDVKAQTEKFDLDDDDEEDQKIRLTIPQNALTGDYEVKLTVFFDDMDEAESEVKVINVVEKKASVATPVQQGDFIYLSGSPSDSYVGEKISLTGSDKFDVGVAEKSTKKTVKDSSRIEVFWNLTQDQLLLIVDIFLIIGIIIEMVMIFKIAKR
jgi:hypothetical protein